MRYRTWLSNLLYSVMKPFCRLMGFVMLGILVHSHAPGWGSAKALRNRENVREGTFVMECSLRKRSRGNVRERTFAKADWGKNVRQKTFAKGDGG